MIVPRRRRWRRAGLLAAALVAGSSLAACGSGSAALVKQACSDVNRSIALFHRSEAEQGAAAKRTRDEALVQLRRALRPAALAGSAGGQYQALQATLSESSRVSESQLIVALSAQCAASTAGPS